MWTKIFGVSLKYVKAKVCLYQTVLRLGWTSYGKENLLRLGEVDTGVIGLQLSKAAMLQKGAEYIRQLRIERSQLKEEMDSLRQQIESLNTSIR